MSSPISPPPVRGGARNELPAYVANGVVGLRVREMPLGAGLTLVSGYSGEHPERRIEAIALVVKKLRVLDLTQADVREAVTQTQDVERLYRSDFASDYL